MATSEFKTRFPNGLKVMTCGQVLATVKPDAIPANMYGAIGAAMLDFCNESTRFLVAYDNMVIPLPRMTNPFMRSLCVGLGMLLADTPVKVMTRDVFYTLTLEPADLPNDTKTDDARECFDGTTIRRTL